MSRGLGVRCERGSNVDDASAQLARGAHAITLSCAFSCKYNPSVLTRTKHRACCNGSKVGGEAGKERLIVQTDQVS